MAAAKDIRIAVVSDAKPERNGVGTYYVDLDHELAGRGVRMRSFHPNGDVPEWLNIPLVTDNTQRLALPAPRALRRALESFAPTHVIVPTPGPYGLLGARFGARLGAEVLVTFHTDYMHLLDIYYRRPLAAISRSWFWLAYRILFHYSTGVLASSEVVLEAARALGARHVDLMGPLLAREFVDGCEPLARPTLERVLFAGRLAAEKNIADILAAAAELPEVRFTIAGDGPLRRLVEEAALRLANVEYLGWLSRDQAREAMDASDLLVLPSAVESFGTVALEAMARARAVLVSPGCGIASWPNLNETLFTMQAGESLASAIVRVASLPCARRNMIASRAREAACALHRRSLDHWLALLAGSDAPLEL